jgi:hypothetical protein
MFNWSEIEEAVRLHQQQLAAPPTHNELALMQLNSGSSPLRSRVAKALVRLSERLDPHVVARHIHDSQHEVLVEGRLAAYIR